MARITFASAAASIGLVVLATGWVAAQNRPELKSVDSFEAISDPKARTVALFEEAGRVIAHPRCVNCHPATARPLQADSRRPHEPPVVRGEGGMGTPGMHCVTCHGPTNAIL